MEIHVLDLHAQALPQVIAAFLVIGPSGPILIETGPGSTLETLKSQLAQHGYAVGDIKHVLVTHIHFDHAGAAGWWAQQGAQVYVHHLGARHLIDPTRLIASATLIYGDKMDSLWGDLLPAPADKITAIYDGDVLEVAGLKLTAIDTPGHARHHHVFQLEGFAFTGDAAGVRLPQTELITLPAPPPEFDLEAWEQTLKRLLAADFSALYLTHFGRVTDVKAQLQTLQALLRESVSFVGYRIEAGLERETIITEYEAWNRQRALDAGVATTLVERYEASNPLYMSVDGIMRYWRKRRV